MKKSGSGKTTLMNVLNFRNHKNLIIDGFVNMNGEIADWKKISLYSSYVQQNDMFYENLTVQEHLTLIVS